MTSQLTRTGSCQRFVQWARTDSKTRDWILTSFWAILLLCTVSGAIYFGIGVVVRCGREVPDACQPKNCTCDCNPTPKPNSLHSAVSGPCNPVQIVLHSQAITAFAILDFMKTTKCGAILDHTWNCKCNCSLHSLPDYFHLPETEPVFQPENSHIPEPKLEYHAFVIVNVILSLILSALATYCAV